MKSTGFKFIIHLSGNFQRQSCGQATNQFNKLNKQAQLVIFFPFLKKKKEKKKFNSNQQLENATSQP
jgi:hypothetical protein